MKIPDRIFISEKTAKIEGFRYKENALEYVRKDTLLKKVMETVERREPHQIDAYNNDDYEAGFIDGADRMRKIVTTIINSL